MTRDELKQIFMLFKAAYPSFIPASNDALKAKLNLWESFFPNTTYAAAEWAAKRCIENCKEPPTVADMKEWLGMGLTRQDVEARKQIEVKPFTYPDNLEEKFQKAMRALNE